MSQASEAPTTVETREFDAFARRILRAYAKRVAAGDIEALPSLCDLARADHAPAAQFDPRARERKVVVSRRGELKPNRRLGQPSKINSPGAAVLRTVMNDSERSAVQVQFFVDWSEIQRLESFWIWFGAFLRSSRTGQSARGELHFRLKPISLIVAMSRGLVWSPALT